MRHWEGRAAAAEARVKNLEKALDPYDHALLKQRDTFQARVEALERQLKIAEHDSVHQSQLYSEYIEEWTKERDTLQKRVAELEERLIVMCVAQLNQWSDGLSEIKSLVAGDYFGA